MTAAPSTPSNAQDQPNPQNIVIVGNGQAGIQLVDSLRKEGYAGTITVIGEETHFPYQRPPLSKDFMAADKEPKPLPLRAEKFFTDNDVDSRLGVQVTSIDRAGHTVELSDESSISYTTLVLATGAANRELNVPGSDLQGIYGLRTLADAEAVHARLDTVRSVVVIGAGFIGLEFAAAARKRGLDVTVLEYADRPMARALSPVMGNWFAQAHLNMGVDLRLGEGIASFTGGGSVDSEGGHVAAAVSTTGETYPADMVLVGIGVIPRTELAEQAGLAVSNGITVDSAMRTDDEDIYALGDCANYPSHHAEARTRLESVQNATDQARHTAKSILDTHDAGRDYTELPWFWSTQGDLRLQIAGIAHPDDETVLRGNPDNGKFSVFCFRNGRLAAVESVNQPADHMAARRILAQERNLTPEQAADLEFDFKAYSKAAAAGV
ncbi:NAD(P)/FAD-dependent oxidoreductase [Arthrobacter sp. VKM Ac-2550]|uniref:NAD(P)/FAD-dependent oxidoreductase n=1 Tax=Crystallibacter permensis TaxID=1938888 RepID=UPI00222614B9|nr:FAD-dependent oxidoreductase [Arthrobacter sp. VKM Ac-2550]MCW2132538.1 3-phenylpropionate/trans-cinnamate dioxygenase ferredoxin reductase subunit [Arthrobacter sp. VKM Ac-2550]